MSASLVGSEMCIRDSYCPAAVGERRPRGRGRARPRARAAAKWRRESGERFSGGPRGASP
eukprot:14489461-Alexandrium_andersonii.AAC.1